MCDPSFCILLPNTLDEGQTEEKKIRWANRGSSSLHSCLILAYSFRRRRRRRRHADERASVFFGSCARKTRVDGGGLSVENEIPFSALHRFESSDLFYLRERAERESEYRRRPLSIYRVVSIIVLVEMCNTSSQSQRLHLNLIVGMRESRIFRGC